MKSLVVEDDPICGRVLQSILSNFGQCSMAGDGVEAVNAFEKSLQDNEPYELICMDIMMPVMNGNQALNVIRKIERQRGVLFDVTGHVERQAVVLGYVRRHVKV